MANFINALRLLLTGYCLLWFCWSVIAQPLFAAPEQQVPVVRPDAVTTPAAPSPGAESNQNIYHETTTERVYVVQAGDTLWDVALEAGLDIGTVPCAIAPTFRTDQPLVIGDQLELPESGTICHQVGQNETINDIAAQYQTTGTAITAVSWNRLTDADAITPLPAGNYLRVPLLLLAGNAMADTLSQEGVGSGTDDFLTWMLDQPVNTSPFLALAVGGSFANQRHEQQVQLNRATVRSDEAGAVPEYWPYGSGEFRWPLAGWLTQGYRYDHRAIDVAAPLGTVVTAADRGVVVRAGWNNQGYGNFVIIDHNIDYVTLYGHLSEILVTEGQVVAQGAIIGKVGSTGNSTGPHLHFEIRDFGRLANPLELLVH